MNKLDSNTVMQIGIIVKDVQKTAEHFAQVFGHPVPEVRPIASDEFAHTTYLGQASEAKGKAAFFDLGPVQMELIEPVGAPSTWDDFLRTKGEGIHHIAIKTSEMAEAQAFLATQGIETIQTGGWNGGQYAYMDGQKQLGTIIELLHFDQ